MYTHKLLHVLLVEIRPLICLFCGFGLLLSIMNFYFDCKTSLCLIVPGRQVKYIFEQESFCLQGILDDIIEQDTSFLDCKHKHMMKSGAPPDKFGVLYCMFTYRMTWFHKQD